MAEQATTETSPLHGELVASRAAEAYELMLSGMSTREIAERLSYENTNAVLIAIKHEFDQDVAFFTPDDKQGLVNLNTARLNRLLAAQWPAAMMGDVASARAALETIKEINKTNRVYDLDASVDQRTVLVIGGREAEYVEKLKELVDGS